jgi:hypothetical protein
MKISLFVVEGKPEERAAVAKELSDSSRFFSLMIAAMLAS